MCNSIYHDLFIKTSSMKVFEAVSEPTHLINWWPRKCTGKPEKGAEYNFLFSPEYDWYGMVMQSEPGKSFHIKMTKSDPDWDPTTFGFDLRDVDSVTQLSFWHKDWPACNQHFKIASYCWAILLQGLKNYAEKGVVVPFEQRQ